MAIFAGVRSCCCPVKKRRDKRNARHTSATNDPSPLLPPSPQPGDFLDLNRPILNERSGVQDNLSFFRYPDECDTEQITSQMSDDDSGHKLVRR